VGRLMIMNAENSKSLAKEQFGRRRQHRAIDLALKKALTFDILCQMK